ncbi:hypothetical protein COLO4_16039 [Corchorus olitorius]|uniref:Uncharacterized protein n=1 Tax=Corchorus olitorius TaxID=93759 RepID=A0A1R3JK91_9ROSI|nr:hypothetical protein COLO4_16039 [Corchorus olitorius]
MANSEITQDLAQVTLSPSFSPSIFLNDEEMVDLEELLASDQPDGAVADMWKDIDDVYLSNIPRELGTKLIPDSSANPAACNADDSSWGAIIIYPAPKCHTLTMPILKNSIFINKVEKRHEFVEDPIVIPIDMNSAPPNENEPNSSIIEAVRSNLPAGWRLVEIINKKELPSLSQCDQVLEEATALISYKDEFYEAVVSQDYLKATLDEMNREFMLIKTQLPKTFPPPESPEENVEE